MLRAFISTLFWFSFPSVALKFSLKIYITTQWPSTMSSYMFTNDCYGKTLCVWFALFPLGARLRRRIQGNRGPSGGKQKVKKRVRQEVVHAYLGTYFRSLLDLRVLCSVRAWLHLDLYLFCTAYNLAYLSCLRLSCDVPRVVHTHHLP